MRIFLYLILLGFATSAIADDKKVRVNVNGMVCGFCAQGITKRFKSERSISSVDVRLGEKTVDLKVKEGESISDDKIKEILTDSGYSVEKILRD